MKEKIADILKREDAAKTFESDKALLRPEPKPEAKPNPVALKKEKTLGTSKNGKGGLIRRSSAGPPGETPKNSSGALPV